MSIFVPAGLWLAALTPLPEVLHLADALALARAQQPQLRQAQASAASADAAVTQARAPLLPQLTGTATYSKSTANFVLSPGALPSSAAVQAARDESATLRDFWALQLGAQQLLFDFGQSPRLLAAAGAEAARARATTAATALMVDMNVRTAFFQARAQGALCHVAAATLANQRRHCEQVAGFIRAGTRAEIDLAQARTDVANARVQHIAAANAYRTARAQLNVAIGIEAGLDYTVADEPMAALAAEQSALEPLIDAALAQRADLQALERAVAAQQSRMAAARSNYWPSLSLGLSGTDRGPSLQELTWNYTVSANLSWQIFAGGLGLGQEAAAGATLQSLLAVETAVLQVAAGRETVAAAGEALHNAQLRLTYAEGRYATGVGSIIELSDAQLALASAQAQQVQAELTLSSARAQLVQALGSG